MAACIAVTLVLKVSIAAQVSIHKSPIRTSRSLKSSLPISVTGEDAAKHLLSTSTTYAPPVSVEVEGNVRLHIVIDELGLVSATKVLSGHKWLQTSAQEIVKRWAYRPFERNGKPVTAETAVEVQFKKNPEDQTYKVWSAAQDNANRLLLNGERQAAIEAFRQSVLAAEKVGDIELADTLGELARALIFNGRYDLAFPVQHRRLIVLLRSRIQNPPEIAQARTDLAMSYVKQNDFEDAASVARPAIPILEEYRAKAKDTDNRAALERSLAVAYFSLAVIYDKTGKAAMAETLYKNSIEIGRKTLSPDEAALVMRLYAAMLRKHGSPEKAGALEADATALQLNLQPTESNKK